MDYGGSEDHSPPSPVQAGSISGTSSPTAQPSHTGGAARITQKELKSHPIKGVILVSEAFTVIILASGHESPITEADLADPFFSSGMVDHALRLGPYMRRSC